MDRAISASEANQRFSEMLREVRRYLANMMKSHDLNVGYGLLDMIDTHLVKDDPVTHTREAPDRVPFLVTGGSDRHFIRNVRTVGLNPGDVLFTDEFDAAADAIQNYNPKPEAVVFHKGRFYGVLMT